MLTLLEVFSPRIATAPIPFVSQAVEEDQIQIRNIEGLGPVAANVNTSKIGSMDGEVYLGSSVGKRNIVITIGINPHWTQSVADIRQMLYMQFMPKSAVRLRFTSTHLPTVDISGYVESFEPNIFSRDPEYQVSIICPQPDFVAITDTVVTSSTDPLGSSAVVAINYAGTVETGFLLSVSKGAGTNYTGPVHVIMSSPGEKPFVFNQLTLSGTETLKINSVSGKKFAKLTYSTATPEKNVLGLVSPASIWPTLEPGSNYIGVYYQAGNLWEVRYRARYGGL